MGFEPILPGPQPGVLPLTLLPHMALGIRVERIFLALQASTLTTSVIQAYKMERMRELESLLQGLEDLYPTIRSHTHVGDKDGYRTH